MNQALASQDDSAIAMMYATDAVIMPPDAPRITGRDSIRKYYAAIGPMKGTLDLTPAAVHVSGDWAIEEGNYTWSMPSPIPNGPAMSDRGKYLTAWHNANGDWMIVRKIWNSDLPTVPMTAPAAKSGRR